MSVLVTSAFAKVQAEVALRECIAAAELEPVPGTDGGQRLKKCPNESQESYNERMFERIEETNPDWAKELGIERAEQAITNLFSSESEAVSDLVTQTENNAAAIEACAEQLNLLLADLQSAYNVVTRAMAKSLDEGGLATDPTPLLNKLREHAGWGGYGNVVPNNRSFRPTDDASQEAVDAIYTTFIQGGVFKDDSNTENSGDYRRARQESLLNVQMDIDSGVARSLLDATSIANWPASGDLLRAVYPTWAEWYKAGEGGIPDDRVLVAPEFDAGGEEGFMTYSFVSMNAFPAGWASALMMLLKNIGVMVATQDQSAPAGGVGSSFASSPTERPGTNFLPDPSDTNEAIMSAETGMQRINYPEYKTTYQQVTGETPETGTAATNTRIVDDVNYGSYLGFRDNSYYVDGMWQSHIQGCLEMINVAADKFTAPSWTQEYEGRALATGYLLVDQADYSESEAYAEITPAVKEGAAAIAAFLGFVSETFTPLITQIKGMYVCILDNAEEQAKTNADLAGLIDGALEGLGPVEAATDQQKLDFDRAVQAIKARELRKLADADVEAARELLQLNQPQSYLFNEQCLLLMFVDIFANYKRRFLDPVSNLFGDTRPELAKANKRLPYVRSNHNIAPAKNNATLLVDGDPYGFINKLTLSSKLAMLMDASNGAISSLQPRIRLFKVVHDTNSAIRSHEVEINFDSHMTSGPNSELERFTEGIGQRGVGAGIKSFNFTYEGSNPFAVKKSIKANLKIFANSMDELFAERIGRKSGVAEGEDTSTTYKYVDLVLKTGGSTLLHTETHTPCAGSGDLQRQNIALADLNFRLKAQVGLAKPLNTGGDSILDPNGDGTLESALHDSFVTLNLTPTVHNFEIDELGRVVLNINYLAYAEEFFDSANFNIFANAPTTIRTSTGETPGPLAAMSRIGRTLALEAVSRKCEDSAAKNKLKEEYKPIIASEVRDSIAWLADSLLSQNKVHYLKIPTKTIGDLTTGRLSSEETIALHGDIDHAVLGASGGLGTLSDVGAEDRDTLVRGINSALQDYADQAGSTDAGAEQDSNAIANALIGGNYVETTLSYFYLSDLIDVILANIDDELDELALGQSLDNFIYTLKAPNGEHFTRADIGEAVIAEKKREMELSKEAFKKLRVLLGPVELQGMSPVADNVTSATYCTLGDLPISVKYFIEFLTDKMLKKGESLYSLTKFLNDIFNILVRDFLNGNECGSGSRQKVRVQQAALTSFSPVHPPNSEGDGGLNANGEFDIITMATSGVGFPATRADGAKETTEDQAAVFRSSISTLETPDGSAILNISGPSNSARSTVGYENEFNFFVYFAGQVQPLSKMQGMRAEDEERGIFHYLLGRDRGLIKNIKLSKTQTKGLAEVRFEQDGYDGLQQMRVIYDVQIDSYANVNTWPGTYIYVDPKGFLPKSTSVAVSDSTQQGGFRMEAMDLTKIGIGGYYMIVRSEHEFAPGTANSTIHAKWVNSIEGDAVTAQCRELETSAQGSGDRENPHCRWNTPPPEEETGTEVPESGIDWWPFWDGIPGI